MQEAATEDYKAYQFHLVMQRIQAFCSEDLGSFYLDILKDRLYTCGADSQPAPLGADRAVPHHPQPDPPDGADPELHRRGVVAAVRQGRQRVREDLALAAGSRSSMRAIFDQLGNCAAAARHRYEGRSRKGARRRRSVHSLAAELDIRASGPAYDAIARLGEELRYVFITSRATAHRAEGPAQVDVKPSANTKCDRCWHYRADVNGEGLCGRCQSNLKGPGEARKYA